MKQGTKMSPTQIQQRFRKTLANQAEKMFTQQMSKPNQVNSQVDLLTEKIQNK